MKVLILSSNNGGGHNAAAMALQECFAAHGDECVIRDCLSFLSENLSENIARSHNFMYRHTPELFDSGYRRSEDNPDLFKEHHRLRSMIDLGRFSLGRYLKAEGFDIVLCTHVFAAMMLTAAKKQYTLPLRTGIVETDYGNTPGFADNDMDLHFLPDAALVPGLLAAGVEESRIVVSGIPVREAILHRTEKAEAKRSLNLEADKPHLLVMGGSMGCGPIPELVERLRSTLEGSAQITVICGSNERLRKSLQAEYGQLREVHILGYVSDMSLLYDSADLLLTKPGGVTTTEAAVKGVPMVLINAVAGCEGHNLDFFLEAGGALTGETAEELCDCCVSLIEDADTLAQMSAALLRLAPGDAAERIYTAMTGPERDLSAAETQITVPVRPDIPHVQSSLRNQILEMPKAIYEASGIVINGRRIKSLVFTTDLAIIRNCDADAVFAVYPFTPQQAISDAIIKASYIPVFCGVGGGITKGLRTVGLAKDVESQGAMGVVLNAPISDLNLAAVARSVDIPVIITIVTPDTDVERRIASGASILNVAGGAQTPMIVEKIRRQFPEIPIIASGGGTEESVRATIRAGANAITYTPPTAQELFKRTMAKYREM